MTADEPGGTASSSGPREPIQGPRPSQLPTPLAATELPLPEGTPGLGPLVQAAHGLLLVAPRLRRLESVAEPEALRRRLVAALDHYRERALGHGPAAPLVEAGHYALCALLDDAVGHSPWGGTDTWRETGLAATLHGDRSGGNRFFELLGKARADPVEMRPLLELMDACLAMGLEGRFRRAAGGASALANLRTDLSAKLATLGGARAEELSPSWRGVRPPPRRLGAHMPLWVGAVAVLTLLMLVYLGFDLRLGAYSERLGPVIARLTPPPATKSDRSIAQPPPGSLGPRLAGCLAPAGVDPIEISDSPARSRVSLPAARLFPLRSADIDPAVDSALQCIGGQLGGAAGRVLVVGHTDDTPAASARFPSNWELSAARAAAVGQALAGAIGDPRRVRVLGRADAEPRVTNSDAYGRARNGRVEVLLLK